MTRVPIGMPSTSGVAQWYNDENKMGDLESNTGKIMRHLSGNWKTKGTRGKREVISGDIWMIIKLDDKKQTGKWGCTKIILPGH